MSWRTWLEVEDWARAENSALLQERSSRSRSRERKEEEMVRTKRGCGKCERVCVELGRREKVTSRGHCMREEVIVKNGCL